MLTQAEQTKQGRRLQSSEGQWNVKQVKRYLRCVDRFLMLLIVCVHMTSGQPGRGSEITTMRHRNRLLQDRNLTNMRRGLQSEPRRDRLSVRVTCLN